MLGMLGKTNDKPVDSELGCEIDQQRTVEFFTEDPQEMMPMSMMSTVFFVPELVGHFTGIPRTCRFE